MEDREKKSKKNLKVSPISGCPPPTGGGRKKGVPNKATTQFKLALNQLFETSAPEMIEWLKKVENPKDRFDILSKFVEILYPKLSRQEQQTLDKDGNPADAVSKIVIEHVSVEKNDRTQDTNS